MRDNGTSGSSSDLATLGDLVERLALLAQRTGLASLELRSGDVEIAIHSTGAIVAADVVSLLETGAPALPNGDIHGGEAPGSVISSPMVGTYYHAVTPSDPPLVQVGDRIEVGQVIGIIEAMKIMNEIPSDRNGLVVEIIVANGTAVEYGSPLLRIAP